MPTYEWKNTETGERVDVERPMSQYDVPPDLPGEWVRVISVATVPWEILRDKGVFEYLPQTSTRKVNK
jgi:hypothetical protein